jgi:hypothetical protein
MSESAHGEPTRPQPQPHQGSRPNLSAPDPVPAHAGPLAPDHQRRGAAALGCQEPPRFRDCFRREAIASSSSAGTEATGRERPAFDPRRASGPLRRLPCSARKAGSSPGVCGRAEERSTSPPGRRARARPRAGLARRRAAPARPVREGPRRHAEAPWRPLRRRAAPRIAAVEKAATRGATSRTRPQAGRDIGSDKAVFSGAHRSPSRRFARRGNPHAADEREHPSW